MSYDCGLSTSAADCRYIVKPSTGKNFVETVLDIEADVKNETGFVFYKLYKVCRRLLPYGIPCWIAPGARGLR